jgi:hypothetical protein
MTHISSGSSGAHPNNVSLVLCVAKLGFDSLIAYAVTPHQPIRIFTPSPPSTWAINSKHSSVHHHKLTPGRVLKHAYPSVVCSHTTEIGNHQHHAPLSSSFISPSFSVLTDLHVDPSDCICYSPYVSTHPKLSNWNHAPPYAVSAQHITVHCSTPCRCMIFAWCTIGSCKPYAHTFALDVADAYKATMILVHLHGTYLTHNKQMLSEQLIPCKWSRMDHYFFLLF